MQQLSGLDASFLHLETAEMPMHVGAAHVLMLPSGYRGNWTAQLRRHLRERLPAMPALTRKLVAMPLNLANPAWVDCEVDMDYHVTEVRLPKPGGYDAFAQVVARLHAQPLDRSRPLWQFTVVKGIAPGQIGLFTRLHHAGVDGQAAVAMAQVILDPSPEPRPPPAASTAERQTRVGLGEMVGGMFSNQVSQIRQLLRSAPSLARAATASLREKSGELAQAGGLKSLAGASIGLAPRTVFNGSIGQARVFAPARLSLPRARALGKAHQASLNDVVLAVCAGALRNYLKGRDALPRKALVAAVPVSLRQEGDDRSNNQASMTVVTLATNVADPRRRFLAQLKSSAAMKQSLSRWKSLMPTDFPSMGLPWLMSRAAHLVGRTRLAERIPVIANLVISNVPGPQFPLYLAGARMERYNPTSIVVHGLALNITIQSYDGKLEFGLVGCARAVTEIAELARGIEDEFERLVQAMAEPAPGRRKAATRTA
ncbi:MAG: wax ester/triacylglycerol synthase family O-acyltransferase [Burkholderiaceae bacterium]|nr:wax ester/triacylglycerol synthase family O-acyltransferase [Burkholderiaceae bacterium]